MSQIESHISSILTENESIIRKTISNMRNRLNLDDDFLFEILEERLPKQLGKNWEEYNATSYSRTIIIQSVKKICDDVEDAILLERKSSELIVKYIPRIYEKVQFLSRTQKIRAHDADDFIQIIQQKLLEKLKAGQLSSFKSNKGTLFSTFLMTVVTNQIKDISKSLYLTQKNQSHLEINEVNSHQLKEDSNVLASMVSSESQAFLLKQFKYLLLTYAEKTKTKLEICLKINTRLLLSIQDATSLNLNIHQSKEMISIFGHSYHHLSLGNLWKSICPYINIYEQKESGPDNHRKWYVRVRNQLVVKLLARSILKDRDDFDDGLILKKLNSERNIGKMGEEWLSDIVEGFYKNAG